MTTSVSPCNQKGEKCTFFDVERVEYSHPHCLLTDNPQVITVVIKGQRTSGGNPHNYELQVLETGRQSFAEFALLTSQPDFKRDVNQQTGTINIDEKLIIIFLARKVQSLSSSSQGIVVRCTFGHGFPDRWHIHRSVDLSLILG